MLNIALSSSTVALATLVATAPSDGAKPAATEPAQIANTSWTFAATSATQATVDVTQLPEDGGAPLAGFELRLSSDGIIWGDSQALADGASTGPRTVTVLDGFTAAQVRAFNSVGNAEWSEAKSISTAPSIMPATIAPQSWIQGVAIEPLRVSDLFMLDSGASIISVRMAGGSDALPGIRLEPFPDFSGNPTLLSGTPTERTAVERTIRLIATTATGSSAIVDIPINVAAGNILAFNALNETDATALSNQAITWDSANQRWVGTRTATNGFTRFGLRLSGLTPGEQYTVTTSVSRGPGASTGNIETEIYDSDFTTKIGETGNIADASFTSQAVTVTPGTSEIVISWRGGDHEGPNPTLYLDAATVVQQTFPAANLTTPPTITSPATASFPDLDGGTVTLTGTDVRRWTVESALPEGLRLDGDTLTARGDAVAAGEYPITVRAWNDDDEHAEQVLTLTVEAIPAPTPFEQTKSVYQAGGLSLSQRTLTLPAVTDTERDHIGYFLAYTNNENLGTTTGKVTICGVDAEHLYTESTDTNAYLSVWRALVPAGTTDRDAVVTTWGSGARIRMAGYLLPKANANQRGYLDSVPYYDIASGNNPNDTSSNEAIDTITLDAPDHGVLLLLGATAGSVASGPFEWDLLENETDTSGDLDGSGTDQLATGWVRYPVERRVLSPVLTGGDSSLQYSSLVALSVATDQSRLVETGPAALATYSGMMQDVTAYVDRAIVIDLADGHIGHDGSGADEPQYAISPALPAGLTLTGSKLEGIPTGTAAATTYTVTVFRGPDSNPANAVESITYTFDLDVQADPGTLNAVWTGTGATVTSATASGFDVDFGTHSETFRRALSSFSTTPGRTYRVSFQIDATSLTGEVHLQVGPTGIDGGNYDDVENSSSTAYLLYQREQIAGGAVRHVSFDVFAPEGSLALRLGNRYGETLSGTATVSGFHVQELSETLLPGDSPVSTQYLRVRGATFVFDKPRTVGIYSPDGTARLGFWAQTNENDPLKVVAILPRSNTATGSSLRNGAMRDYGTRTVGLTHPGVNRDAGVGFDGRMSAAGSFAASANDDPGFTGQPITFTGEGSVTKALSRRDGATITASVKSAIDDLCDLTVVDSTPPSDAFMPSLALTAKDHLRHSDMAADWLDAFPSLPAPAGLSMRGFNETRAYIWNAGHDALVGNNPSYTELLANQNHSSPYGENSSTDFYGVQARLMLDTGTVSVAAKRELALYAIQLGLHYLGRAAAGGIPQLSTGGGNHNRKWAAVLADLFLGSTAIATAQDWAGSLRPATLFSGNAKSGSVKFGEDIWYGSVVQQIDIDSSRTEQIPGRPIAPFYPYMLGLPFFGDKDDRQDIGSNYDQSYRPYTATAAMGLVLLGRMTGGWAAWGNLDALGVPQAVRYLDDFVVNDPQYLNSTNQDIWEAFRADGKPVYNGTNGLVVNGDYTYPSDGAIVAARTATKIPLVPVEWSAGAETTFALGGLFNRGMTGGDPTSFSIQAVHEYNTGTDSWDSISTPAWMTVSGTDLVATPPDTALYRVTIRGTNASGSDDGYLMIQDSATANGVWP